LLKRHRLLFLHVPRLPAKSVFERRALTGSVLNRMPVAARDSAPADDAATTNANANANADDVNVSGETHAHTVNGNGSGLPALSVNIGGGGTGKKRGDDDDGDDEKKDDGGGDGRARVAFRGSITFKDSGSRYLTQAEAASTVPYLQGIHDDQRYGQKINEQVRSAIFLVVFLLFSCCFLVVVLLFACCFLVDKVRCATPM
jgi:hypothetical protein